MVRVVRQPSGLAPPQGTYSHLAVATGSTLVAVAGQVGRDQDGRLVGDGRVGEQTRQAFRNVGAALQEARLAWGDVLTTTTYVVGREHLDGFVAARSEVFAELFPTGAYPPNTLLLVAGLADEELLVEVEALAVR